MIGLVVPAPPLRHSATLERNVETGKSPTNQRLPARFEVLEAELPCSYWEPSRAADAQGAGLREGPAVNIHALGPRMIVSTLADVRVGDRVTEVRGQGGDGRTYVITRQAARVVEVLWRESHQEAGLELISAGPVVETGS